MTDLDEAERIAREILGAQRTWFVGREPSYGEKLAEAFLRVLPVVRAAIQQESNGAYAREVNSHVRKGEAFMSYRPSIDALECAVRAMREGKP